MTRESARRDRETGFDFSRKRIASRRIPLSPHAAFRAAACGSFFSLRQLGAGLAPESCGAGTFHQITR
jgi:hypothetical protein